MNSNNGKPDLSDIDLSKLQHPSYEKFNEETTEKKVGIFLDKGFSIERINTILTEGHRLELINQLVESFSVGVIKVLDLNKDDTLEKQRDNITDLVRMIDLYKESLLQISDKKLIEDGLKFRIEYLEKSENSLKEEIGELENKLEGSEDINEELGKTNRKLLKKVNNLIIKIEQYKDIIRQNKYTTEKIKKSKKRILLEEFLGSKMGNQLLEKELSILTVKLEEEIALLDIRNTRLIGKNEKLTTDKSRISISLNQITLSFEEFKIEIEKIILLLPTRKQYDELVIKNNKLIMENANIILQSSKAEERAEKVEKEIERVNAKNRKILEENEKMKKEMEELKRKTPINNTHIKKQAHKAYGEL